MPPSKEPHVLGHVLLLQPFIKTRERARKNKQDMFGRNALRRGIPPAQKDLRDHARLLLDGNLSLLHNLQKRVLHASITRYSLTSRSGSLLAATQLIYFINIDDAVLREFDIPIRLLDELSHQIFRILADNARLREFRGICSYEGHA